VSENNYGRTGSSLIDFFVRYYTGVYLHNVCKTNDVRSAWNRRAFRWSPRKSSRVRSFRSYPIGRRTPPSGVSRGIPFRTPETFGVHGFARTYLGTISRATAFRAGPEKEIRATAVAAQLTATTRARVALDKAAASSVRVPLYRRRHRPAFESAGQRTLFAPRTYNYRTLTGIAFRNWTFGRSRCSRKNDI